MNKSLYGEYDNYHYRSSDEMTLEEQLESARKAMDAVARLSKDNTSDYWNRKRIEIKAKINQLEQLKQ